MPSPVIETLAALVRIDSVNPQFGGPGEAGVAAFVAEFLGARGIEARRTTVLPGRDNVVGVVPGRDPSRRVVLEAHMDVVSTTGMTIPPFDPVIDGGRLFGRGACDTKAGLAGMLHAVAELAGAAEPPPCDVWLAAVIDEEHLFRGVTALCASIPAPLPGGPRSASIVAEPTESRVVVATKGVVRWEVVFHGRAAHSSKPALGINAISHAAAFVREVDALHAALAGRTHPLLGPATGNVGVIGGGVQVNFVPDRCTLQIDRRLLPGERADEVLATYGAILERMAAADASVRGELLPPFLVDEALETPPDARAVQVAGAVARALGLDPGPVGVPYGSDASKLSRHGLDCLVFGPGSIDQAHAAVEWVEIAQVERAAEFYREFCRRYE
ncbi:MAG: M20 family metallopeptidase [Planctomycetaceae bacterium]